MMRWLEHVNGAYKQKDNTPKKFNCEMAVHSLACCVVTFWIFWFVCRAPHLADHRIQSALRR